ncbi:MobA/MobL family protein [Xanthomonas citri pv. malvacearum]|uniref:MobA/MobL family protein n=1 Tax=Xanthomonas citri TaxID=346 RepID=UPI0022AFC444|nr:MobA/MobL family protein [Xanthomonas citri]WAW94269.1 MobA/MobL family protein [Xanthomonas citri pv. malvacearum]
MGSIQHTGYYRCAVHVYRKGDAAERGEYVVREGRYRNLLLRPERRAKSEMFVAGGFGNMPAWAQHQPHLFWQADDQYERTNGSTYREIEAAFPRQLSPEGRQKVVAALIDQIPGKCHAYTWGIHNQIASDGGEQPHVHLIWSERIQDGIDRPPERFFARAAAGVTCKKTGNKAPVDPAAGGCRKAGHGSPEFLAYIRQTWEELVNRQLSLEGSQIRVDRRSYADRRVAAAADGDMALAQSLEVIPGFHLGPKAWAMERRGMVTELGGRNRLIRARNVLKQVGDEEYALSTEQAKAEMLIDMKLARLSIARRTYMVGRDDPRWGAYELELRRIVGSGIALPPDLVESSLQDMGDLFTALADALEAQGFGVEELARRVAVELTKVEPHSEENSGEHRPDGGDFDTAFEPS